MRVAILVVAILLFGVGASMGYMDQVSAAVATYGAAVLVLIFAFLPEFKRFKGLGIEAELLDRKIEEADELLSQLRGIAVPIAEMLLSATARMGRWGTAMPRHQKLVLLERIERELRNVGVSEDQLERAKGDWHFFNMFDLVDPVVTRVQEVLRKHWRSTTKARDQIRQPINSENKQEFDCLTQKAREIEGEIEGLQDELTITDYYSRGSSLRSRIQNSAVLSEDEKNDLIEELEEPISDIEYYAENREFRRPEVWLAGDER